GSRAERPAVPAGAGEMRKLRNSSRPCARFPSRAVAPQLLFDGPGDQPVAGGRIALHLTDGGDPSFLRSGLEKACDGLADIGGRRLSLGRGGSLDAREQDEVTDQREDGLIARFAKSAHDLT